MVVAAQKAERNHGHREGSMRRIADGLFKCVAWGRGSNDALYGRSGDDWVGGVNGKETARGGHGVDSCVSVELRVSCRVWQD
jgi:hypothetical protein